MTEDLQTRARRALSEQEEIRVQLDRLSDLEGSGGVSAEAAAEIREELLGKAGTIRETLGEMVHGIQDQLKSLEEEMAAKKKEREVIEAKHRIGALGDDQYSEKSKALESELQDFESTINDLALLNDKLQKLNKSDLPGEGCDGETQKEPRTRRPGTGAKSKPTMDGREPRICGGCGTKNRHGAAFCKNCGERLETGDEVQPGVEGKKGLDVEKAVEKGELASERTGKPRRVLFLGVHSGRVIGEKVSGYDEVFNHLTGMGVEVKYEMARGKGPFTPVEPGYLVKFGAVFVLGSHNDRFDSRKILQEGEVSVLMDYVAGGGGLLVTPCIYGSSFNYLEVKDGLAQLCSGLGVRFPVDHGDLIDPGKRVKGGESHYPGKKDDWALIEAGDHPMVDGLEKISFGPHGGAYLKIEGGNDPLLGGVEAVLRTGRDQEPTEAPVMVLSRYGEGKAITFGSPTAFMHPELFSSKLVQNTELLVRITEFLLEW